MEKNPSLHSIAIFDMNTKELTIVPFKGTAILSDINDKQQVVGWSDSGTLRGFIWHKDFGFQVLPAFIPSAINNKGVVVGQKYGRAVIYENGVSRDLNEMLGLVYDPDSDWTWICQIVDINDNGWMVGCGKRTSDFCHYEGHAVLIIPQE